MGVLSGALCLVGVFGMSCATALPFTSTRCVGCLETAGQSQYLTWSIAEGLDFRIFLVILIILGAAVIGYLAGLHRHVTGTASLFASVGAAGAAFFEGSAGGSRVLPASYEATHPPLSLDVGFYVFIVGAVVAVVASLIMLATSIRSSDAATDAPLQPLAL